MVQLQCCHQKEGRVVSEICLHDTVATDVLEHSAIHYSQRVPNASLQQQNKTLDTNSDGYAMCWLVDVLHTVSV